MSKLCFPCPEERRTHLPCVPQIARNGCQTTLRTDQLRDYDKVHATGHAIGAKVFTDLHHDDDGTLDGQERRVGAHCNPEPDQSDDESSSLDDTTDRHVQDQDLEHAHAFIDDGGAESEAAELNEEDEEDDAEGDEEDCRDDSGEEEDGEGDEEDDGEEGDVGSW